MHPTLQIDIPGGRKIIEIMNLFAHSRGVGQLSRLLFVKTRNLWNELSHLLVLFRASLALIIDHVSKVECPRANSCLSPMRLYNNNRDLESSKVLRYEIDNSIFQGCNRSTKLPCKVKGDVYITGCSRVNTNFRADSWMEDTSA